MWKTTRCETETLEATLNRLDSEGYEIVQIIDGNIFYTVVGYKDDPKEKAPEPRPTATVTNYGPAGRPPAQEPRNGRKR